MRIGYLCTRKPPQAEPTSVKSACEKNTHDMLLKADEMRHSGGNAGVSVSQAEGLVSVGTYIAWHGQRR